MRRRELRRVAGFGLVGSVVFLVYLGVMSAAIMLGASQVGGAFAGFVIGTMVSYFANSRLSFEVRPSGAHSVRFWAVTLVGLGCNLVIASAFEHFNAPYGVSVVAIFCTVPVINYLGHRFWTFRTALQSESPR